MKSKRKFLTLDEISPTVHMAACWRWNNVRHRYRVPSHHLLLIESGRIEARTPDGRFEGRAGDLLCFRPTDWNEYGARGVSVTYEAHLEFAPPPKHLYTPHLDEFGPLPVRIPLGRAFEETRRVFEILCIEITRTGAPHRLRIRSAVHEMLALIAGVLTGTSDHYRHLDEWQRMRLRLDREPPRECDVGRLARQMGLSRAYFIRAFRQRFGLTPKLYHTHVRLREAARLLRSTTQPVKAIAYELGFGDSRTFSRLFKRHLGVLPSDLHLDQGPAAKTAPPLVGRLFPMNSHLVPPEAAPYWIRRYYPRKHGPHYVMSVPEEGASARDEKRSD